MYNKDLTTDRGDSLYKFIYINKRGKISHCSEMTFYNDDNAKRQAEYFLLQNETYMSISIERLIELPNKWLQIKII